jgi:RNA 3'-terminal phosphate cyclase (ATP)
VLEVDGSQGEGGGQILRTSLALSLVTARPFHLTRIRAARQRPGLQRQHLTAVQAAATVGRADVRGAELGSAELTFVPGVVTPGEYHFAIGTAGSACLVLQTILPPLLRAAAPSRLTLTGGTHNQQAPPFDFLARTFAPVVSRLGPSIDVRLVRPGFYPAGGGELVATIVPAETWRRLELLERGELRRKRARALVARLSPEIARRELREVQRQLGWSEAELVVEEVRDSLGPGNVIMLELEFAHITEVLTGFGARGVPAEAVAKSAIEQAQRYLGVDAPVGLHLADQLLLPLALAGGGTFRTLELSLHARTNLEVIRRFLEVEIQTHREPTGGSRVTVSGRT